MAIHVDDFIYTGSSKFKKNVISKLTSTFEISVQQCGNFKYVGLDLVQVGGEVQLNQDTYIKGMKPIDISISRAQQSKALVTPEERSSIKSACGKLLWVANNTRPDLSYDTCQMCCLGKSAVVGDISKINKLIRRAKQDSVKVKYPGLGDPNQWTVTVYCDASFANLPDGSSQGGFIVFLTSPKNKAAPMLWQSKKLQRITRSTLTSETVSMVEAVDAAFLLKKQVEEVLGVKPHIVVHTDNKSLYETVHTSKVLMDRSVRVSIGSLRQRVNRKEITVKWTSTSQQLADSLTKQGSSRALLLDVLKQSRI